VPATVAVPAATAGRITGTKRWCRRHLAGRVLVPARTGEGTSTVFLVDPAAGVTHEATSLDERRAAHQPHVVLDVVGADDVLGEVDGGAEVVAWITDRAVAGLCAIQAGVCEMALRTTATYTSERKQFDTPIATFQAVAHRCADAYIDTEAIRLTAYQAPGASTRGCRPARSWPSPSSGRPRVPSAWCTPRSTSTAASASTSTTRSTAPSAGPSTWSSASAAPPPTCAASAR
jgi:3-oxocholest-4-en-26-oyl-CoA dehydrogenase beta subunit